MRKLSRVGWAGLAASFVMVCGSSAALTATVMAREGSDDTPVSSHDSTDVKTTSENENEMNNSANREDRGEHRLNAAKMVACRAREHGIDNAMNRIATRGQRHLNFISDVATKVEDFYTKQGNTLANYDQLVSDVNAKKAAAQTAVDNVKNSSTTFDCGSSDPKGMATGFVSKVRAMLQALKDYKTAVKALIAGVRSVQPTGGDQ